MAAIGTTPVSTVEEGCDAVLHLATSDDVEGKSGLFFEEAPRARQRPKPGTGCPGSTTQAARADRRTKVVISRTPCTSAACTGTQTASADYLVGPRPFGRDGLSSAIGSAAPFFGSIR